MAEITALVPSLSLSCDTSFQFGPDMGNPPLMRVNLTNPAYNRLNGRAVCGSPGLRTTTKETKKAKRWDPKQKPPEAGARRFLRERALQRRPYQSSGQGSTIFHSSVPLVIFFISVVSPPLRRIQSFTVSG